MEPYNSVQTLPLNRLGRRTWAAMMRKAAMERRKLGFQKHIRNVNEARQRGLEIRIAKIRMRKAQRLAGV